LAKVISVHCININYEKQEVGGLNRALLAYQHMKSNFRSKKLNRYIANKKPVLKWRSYKLWVKWVNLGTVIFWVLLFGFTTFVHRIPKFIVPAKNLSEYGQ